MNKDQKRKQQLHENAQNESLTFQTMYGARQKFGELIADIETRLSEKIIVFKNMGVAEELLTLKTIVDAVQLLGYVAEPSEDILSESLLLIVLVLSWQPCRDGR